MTGNLSVSSQQTRFDPSEGAYHGLHIKDVNIAINSLPNEASPASESRSRRKAKTQSLDLLTGAELRIKPGACYGLIGRNGTGKSSKSSSHTLAKFVGPALREMVSALLRAVAEKLIPGVPWNTKIVLLQQTSEESSQKETFAVSPSFEAEFPGKNMELLPALNYVVESDVHRSHFQRDVEVLSKAFDEQSDTLGPVRAYRRLKHERLQRKLFQAERTARLRSGARGYDARKELIAVEKEVSDAEALLKQTDSEISESAVTEETELVLSIWTDLQSQASDYQPSTTEARARDLLTGLGFTPSLLKKPFANLSGGWKMRCLLASTLYLPRDVLVLDEPTNFLDLLGIIWLEKHLQSLLDTQPHMSIILVSHDRDFVNALCTDTIILRNHALTYFGGNLAAYELDLHERITHMTTVKEAQDKQVDKMQTAIHDSMKRGKKSGDDKRIKQAKSKQKRLDERMGMQTSALGHRFKLNRDMEGWFTEMRQAVEVPEDEKIVHISIPPALSLRFPGALVALDNISLKYKTATAPTLKNVNLVVHRGDRIGIVGLNGSGKTTLIRVLTESLHYTSGNLTKHSQLKLGYYSQHAVEELRKLGNESPNLTALGLLMSDAAAAGSPLSEPAARSLLGALGLRGRPAAEIPVTKLSGGQLVRVALARCARDGPHVLVLDEVSTHLDYQTVRALVEVFSEWEGAIVVVSHDRWMVRAVVQGEKDEEGSDSGSSRDEDEDGRRRIVYMLKGGNLVELEGGIQSFEEKLEKRIDKLTLE